MTTKQAPQPPLYSIEREQRVADALRENLRKRKAQQQAKTRKNDEGK
jgi:hypothetical protein